MRHARGHKGIDLNIGVSPLGEYAGVYYFHQISPSFYGRHGVGFEKGDFKGAKYSSFYIDGTMNYSAYNFQKYFFLAFALGLSGSYDDISGFEASEEYVSAFNLNYGILAGVEAEVFLTKKVAAVANAYQRFYFRNTFGALRLTAGIGIRILL